MAQPQQDHLLQNPSHQNGSVSGVGQPPLPGDSAVTRAEKADAVSSSPAHLDVSPSKRKLAEADEGPPRKKGQAPIKPEYLVHYSQPAATNGGAGDSQPAKQDDRDGPTQQPKGKKPKSKGQNTNRSFGFSDDAIRLCTSRVLSNEFSPKECRFGDSCRLEHDLRRYLKDGKREDLETFSGLCPVFEARGRCNVGWKCRFARSHSDEIAHADGRKELVLREDASKIAATQAADQADDDEPNLGVVNTVSAGTKITMRKKQYDFTKSEKIANWLNDISEAGKDGSLSKSAKLKQQREQKPKNSQHTAEEAEADGERNSSSDEEDDQKQDQRAQFSDPPFKPSEKRRLYYGPETPILAPLTTQGNLPFRRLCVDLGAQVTWSEMAMGLPLIQGEKQEWALMRAHESETLPPAFAPQISVPSAYDHAKDLKFGTQIAGNKPWLAVKTTQVVTELCPHLRAVDLNCGCPIDLVYRQGAGSALLDAPSRLEKILRGMNIVSGEVPVTVKIRMGTKDNQPTADKLVNRLAFGGAESKDLNLGPCGVAAITLHGRSRQQRYTRSADWSYISQCAAIVKRYNESKDALSDTIREPDARDLPSGQHERLYFVGNGDCYSHVDYREHIAHAGVDSVMVARGALIKPWVFEEINVGQHLDKSASERLQYVERFARYGLDTWGSDEKGVGVTRRFLLEWLSFACRYVPIGLLEVLPPNIQDRPPAYRGRNELETLLASDNYKDWIKISEMFLGKAASGFKFEPKHKSNAYEETEG